jgi:exonuclease III
MLRLLTWNILHGGGSARLPEIVLALLGHAPDVIVVTEYRTTTGGQIRGILADHGWEHQACSDPPGRRNGVLLASRFPITPEAPPSGCPVPERWVRARVTPPGSSFAGNSTGSSGVRVVGIHIPDDSRPRERREVWKHLVSEAKVRRDEPVVVLGDLNTGRHYTDEEDATFSCTQRLGELATLGYVDAWRTMHPEKREFTWYGLPPITFAPKHLRTRSDAGPRPLSAKTAALDRPKDARGRAIRGFRLDAAWVSPVLAPRVREAFHSHRERENRLSDHSLVIVTIDVR